MNLHFDNLKNWIEYYYYLTLVFAVSDFVFGLNFRTTGFEMFPDFKKIYYLICFTLGFIIHARSNLGTCIAVTESLINIFAIGYSLYLVDTQLYQTVENPELGGNIFGLIESRNNYYLNFILCIVIMTLAVSIPAWIKHYKTIKSKTGKKR